MTEAYLGFSPQSDIPWWEPTDWDICCFTEELQPRRRNPATLTNILTSVKMAFILLGLRTQSMTCLKVRWTLDAAARQKGLASHVKPPISTRLLRSVIMLLAASHTGRRTRLAVLLMYFTGLRQSEVSPTSAVSFALLRHTPKHDPCEVAEAPVADSERGKEHAEI